MLYVYTFFIGVNTSSSQKGQTKEKAQSKWPCFSQIEYSDLTLVK